MVHASIYRDLPVADDYLLLADDDFRYAGTNTHLPYYRFSNQDNQQITTQKHCTKLDFESSNASYCKNRPLRTSGNADDLFALGQRCIS